MKVDTGIGVIEDRFPFSIDTGLSNPYGVELGELETPIGMIEVDAEFSFDIPHRSVCVAVTLADLLAIAKVCTTF